MFSAIRSREVLEGMAFFDAAPEDEDLLPVPVSQVELDQVLCFAYTGQVEVKKADYEGLLFAADKLGADELLSLALDEARRPALELLPAASIVRFLDHAPPGITAFAEEQAARHFRLLARSPSFADL